MQSLKNFFPPDKNDYFLLLVERSNMLILPVYQQSASELEAWKTVLQNLGKVFSKVKRSVMISQIDKPISKLLTLFNKYLFNAQWMQKSLLLYSF